MYQNQSWQPDYIQKDGCLACELVTQAELAAGREMTHDEALTLWQNLNAYGILGTEAGKENTGAYVWNLPEVYNRASMALGSTKRIRYVAARFACDYKAKYPSLKDWGSTDNVEWVILQVRTTRLHGHFRGADHDPWEGGAGVTDLKAVYYFAVEA